jgi:DNA polymerase-3 subunit epsilon
MAWHEHEIFFVDFEGSRASGVVEYGVAGLLGGRIVEAKSRLCGATGPVRAEDTAVHGLGEDSLKTAPPLAADWEFFAGLRERGPLAAHYAGVENALLKSVWPYPRRSPDFVRPGAWVIDWGPWIDSARVYSQLYPRLESGRLDALVAASGLQGDLDRLAGAHCPPGRRRYHAALYDALAGALLMAALARDPAHAGLSLGQLITMSTLDPGKRAGLTQAELW